MDLDQADGFFVLHTEQVACEDVVAKGFGARIAMMSVDEGAAHFDEVANLNRDASTG